MATDATTDLPTPPPAPPKPSTPEKPGTVALSTGSTVTLRETNGADDFRVERILAEKNIPLTGAGALLYVKSCAVCAILEKDGHMQTPPETYEALQVLLSTFKTRDMNKIVAAYTALNGEDGPTFPGQD